MADLMTTKVSKIRVRSQRGIRMETVTNPEETQWLEKAGPKRGEAFVKNLAVASALVLCVITLRTGVVPSVRNVTDTVLTAAADNSLLDVQLGKLSFVSTLFPEAVPVFGENNGAKLNLPDDAGTIVHAWSESEPYTSWQTVNREVTASIEGEISGIFHGNGEERLVQVMGYHGLSCLYGNLSTINVQIGDVVSAGDVLGYLADGLDYVLEVRQNGRSIDPMLYLTK